MMDMMNNGHGSMMGGMWFFSILFWVLIIAGVIFITKWFLERNRNQDGSGINEESALDILRAKTTTSSVLQTYECQPNLAHCDWRGIPKRHKRRIHLGEHDDR